MAENENVWKMNAFVSCYKMQEKTKVHMNKVEKGCDETTAGELRFTTLSLVYSFMTVEGRGFLCVIYGLQDLIQ